MRSFPGMSELAPATLEGWYVLHQAWTTNWPAFKILQDSQRRAVADEATTLFQSLAAPAEGGWSAPFRLVGGGADWMFVHFRPTLEALGDLELQFRASQLADLLQLEFDYLSVTEAGLYHATAQAAAEFGPNTDAFRAALAEAAEAERASSHVQSRLFPTPPDAMPYLSFYPMTKRRTGGDNWYTVPMEERSRMMRDHGLIGRHYAGRIFQVISGSIGLDDWEWGVTLFGRDPLDFKRLVTEMRFDEASARYGEFGRFWTGVRFAPEEWPALLTGNL